MAGVTDVPFRSLCRSFMNQGLTDVYDDKVKPDHTPFIRKSDDYSSSICSREQEDHETC